MESLPEILTAVRNLTEAKTLLGPYLSAAESQALNNLLELKATEAIERIKNYVKHASSS